MMGQSLPANFSELAASRRKWIDEVLIPWCKKASRTDLRLAEMEWEDIAGRVTPESTLWTWAWSRFPELVYEGLPGVNETCEVTVTTTDGCEYRGYPDNRQSEHGRLVLVFQTEPNTREFATTEPISLDDIESVAVAS